MKTKRDPNYFALLIVGMMFIVLGIIIGEPDTVKPVFIAIGGLFLIASFANKDKWQK
ncbi:hypothetical protein GOV13_00130 [Candidatus Pacearchaeota archaeon]|nr:hypothetical protein [Candidatus Pacearchaeota archaeon]